MKRWLLNIGAVASVVLWAVSTVVWVASYRSWGLAAFKTERNELRLAWASGRLEFWLARVDRDFPLDEKSRRWNFYTNQAPPRTWAWNGPEATIWNAGGFGWFTGGASGVRFYSVYVPFWVEWLVMLVLALWAARRGRKGWLKRRQNRRRLAGLCAFCGYDRRATAGPCPECGKEAAA